MRQGNDFWFMLSGGLKNRGFEKLGLKCVCILQYKALFRGNW